MSLPGHRKFNCAFPLEAGTFSQVVHTFLQLRDRLCLIIDSYSQNFDRLVSELQAFFLNQRLLFPVAFAFL